MTKDLHMMSEQNSINLTVAAITHKDHMYVRYELHDKKPTKAIQIEVS